jgi:uncharacterized protein
VRSDFYPWQLTESGSHIRRVLAADELPRVAAAVRCIIEPVKVELVGATSAAGLATLEGFIRTAVEVSCQRCLEPMELDIRIDVKLAVLETEDRLAEFAPDFDPLIIDVGAGLSLSDVVSDEVLLGLPLAPCHDRESGERDICLSADDRVAYFGVGPTGQKPFAELAQLLNSRNTQSKE